MLWRRRTGRRGCSSKPRKPGTRRQNSRVERQTDGRVQVGEVPAIRISVRLVLSGDCSVEPRHCWPRHGPSAVSDHPRDQWKSEDYAGTEFSQTLGFASGERLFQDVISSVLREAVLQVLAVGRPEQPPHDSGRTQYSPRRSALHRNNLPVLSCRNRGGFSVRIRQEFSVWRNTQTASAIFSPRILAISTDAPPSTGIRKILCMSS